ncbi:MAG: type II secretion system F family protein [Tepidisphaeraceae bacterium]
MPTFQYEAMNAAGQEVKAEIDAGTADEAIAKIRTQGYFPTKVKEKAAKKQKGAGPAGGGASSGTAKKGGMSLSFGGVSTKTITQFTRQLSTLQDAGLPILRSLQILESQQKPGLLKAIIGGVADEVEGGGTLSEAMAKYPKAFDKLYVNMINAGEAGGVLDLILARLADFMEKAARLKKKVIGAMIYPAVVISIAVAIVSMIMIFVIPKFEQIFLDFGVKLPAITQYLLDVSRWFANWGWAYVLASPIVISTVWKLIRTSEGGKYATDAIKLKVPILGNILGKTAIARFTRTLGTLISAGVPILDAINITKETCGNEVYSRALAKVHDAIREGESMADPLRATKVCDAIVVNMVDVGEETGDLDKMLMKVADNYDSDVDVLVGSLISILEPVMVVVLGVIVGFIVIALFMPMITLIQGMSGGK